MLKRVFWVALYTGTAQVLSLIAVSQVLRNLGEKTSGYMGIVDSYILIMATVVSFGIQLSVNRNVAITKGWKSNYQLAQSSRLTVGLLLMALGILSLVYKWEISKLVLIFAPLVALNGDYTLYGKGQPITAARLSLVRVALPNLAIIISSYWLKESSIYYYIIFAGIGLLNSGFWAARINHTPYFYQPRKSFYKFYAKYAKVGVFQLSYALMLTGILAFAKNFYPIVIIGLVYGVLKYFEVFKGVLRIIVQAFFRELKNENTNLKIDKAGMLIGVGAIIPTIIFPNTTLTLLYEQTYEGKETLLTLFGIAMLVSSFKTSSDMRLLILKKDNINLYTYLTAIITTFTIVALFSFSEWQVYGIGIGILVGESILLIGLGYNISGIGFFIERIVFAFKLMVVPAISFVLQMLFGESILLLGTTLALYALWVFIFYRKLLFDNTLVEQSKQ